LGSREVIAEIRLSSAKLDKYAHVLSPLAVVQLMPNMIVTCAKRGQGHLSCWRATRAFGIVKETF